MDGEHQKDVEHEKEGFAKRIVHKLHRKHEKDGSDDGKPLHDGPDPHPRHPKVEGCDSHSKQPHPSRHTLLLYDQS